MGAHTSTPTHSPERNTCENRPGTKTVNVPHIQNNSTVSSDSSSLSKSLPSPGPGKGEGSGCIRLRSSSTSHTDGVLRNGDNTTSSINVVAEDGDGSSPSTSSGSDSSSLSNFSIWKVVQSGKMKAHSVLNVGESSRRNPLRTAQSLGNDRPSNSRNQSGEDAQRKTRWRPWGSSSSSSEDDMDAISEMALQTIGLDQIRRTRFSQGRWSYPGLKCPVCSRSVPPDDLECHLVICLTKPRLIYNEDVLTEKKDECIICFEEMEEGETIARLPCLCIYHKTCIDKWFEVNRSCPEHPEE
ncbi:hypothetical protein QYM36_014234 [Artemia franciscana]|uniref:E3 ubiquitin-protein ligase ZNRF1 n=2 Tax=Artemia franciscana TaxID=6661 RepID=A0AA88HMT6_ARTSF|nr:hypothetical protein QYM36_014234 [Artemia franciscana]KAK2708556.1 hypothetical protein QYM36_014234 [Artemia franciscana]KAK2708558.1 hypothetical protein QYM36_014234 [Artemia franciscana]